MALWFRAWLISSCVAVSSGTARAAPVVEVTALPVGADCVSPADLERRVHGNGADPARRFQVRISAAERGGWQAIVTVRNAEGTRLGERQLATADPDCHDLDAALFVVVDALLDAPVEALVEA